MFLVDNIDNSLPFEEAWGAINKLCQDAWKEVTAGAGKWHPDEKILQFMYNSGTTAIIQIKQEGNLCGYAIAYKNRKLNDITSANLVVMSMYIKPEYRDSTAFLVIFRALKKIAKTQSCSGIIFNMPCKLYQEAKLKGLFGKPVDYCFKYSLE